MSTRALRERFDKRVSTIMFRQRLLIQACFVHSSTGAESSPGRGRWKPQRTKACNGKPGTRCTRGVCLPSVYLPLRGGRNNLISPDNTREHIRRLSPWPSLPLQLQSPRQIAHLLHLVVAPDSRPETPSIRGTWHKTAASPEVPN